MESPPQLYSLTDFPELNYSQNAQINRDGRSETQIQVRSCQIPVVLSMGFTRVPQFLNFLNWVIEQELRSQVEVDASCALPISQIKKNMKFPVPSNLLPSTDAHKAFLIL